MVGAQLRNQSDKPKPHLDGFDWWKNWRPFLHSQVGGSAAQTAWLPFKKDLEPDPVIRPEDVGPNEIPQPPRAALDYSTIDPKAILQAGQHLMPESSPLLAEDYFGVRELVQMRELFEAGLHLGHKVGTLHPRMARFLFGQRLGICIFDLDQSIETFRLALNFVAHMAYRGAIILFAGHNR